MARSDLTMSLIASRVGATDIMFLQARSELSTFVQKDMPFFANWTHQFSRSELDRKEARLKELEEMLEVKFLRYCDFGKIFFFQHRVA